MNILLIGGTGVISTEIMNLCIDRGFSVYLLNRGNNKQLINSQAILIQEDINKVEEVRKKIDSFFFDVVVDFLSYNEDQLGRSLSIFRGKCKQYVFISSVAVYDREGVDDLIAEDNCHMPNRLWDYSVNKLICEDLLKSKCNEWNIKYTIVRPSVTYGDTRIPYGITPNYGYHWTLISRILNNKPIITWGGGNNICTLTHSEDFAKGFIGLLGNDSAYNEAFHIVGSEQYTWLEVLTMISKILKKDYIAIDIPVEFIASKSPYLEGVLIGDRAVDARYDNSKIKSVVNNFDSSITLEDGLRRTINFYKENNYVRGIDYSWDADMDRIISSYLKKNNSKLLKSTSLSFIDYIGGTYKDRIRYYMYRYNSMNSIVSIARKSIHLFKNIVKK